MFTQTITSAKAAVVNVSRKPATDTGAHRESNGTRQASVTTDAHPTTIVVSSTRAAVSPKVADDSSAAMPISAATENETIVTATTARRTGALS